MTDDQDFSDAPLSIGELRSARSQNGADWTPRDLLASLLRDIDAGRLKPTAMVAMYSYDGEAPGVVRTSFRASSPDALTTSGLVAVVANQILRESRDD